MAGNRQNIQSAPPEMGQADAEKFIRRGYDALAQGQVSEATNCAKLVLKYRRDIPQAHFLVGLIGLERSDYTIARQAFEQVTILDPNAAAAFAQLARVFVILGQYNNAHLAIAEAEKLTLNDASSMDVLATAYSLTGDQDRAIYWYSHAIEKDPRPIFYLNRAKARMFTADFKGTKADLTVTLKAQPAAGMPHWMLSRLEKATDDSHIKTMIGHAQSLKESDFDSPFFWYGIGKEYEDLEQFDQAFDAYEKGATAQRCQITYDEDNEIDLFERLHQTYTKEWLDSKLGQGVETKAPIFIIGQPRTGTTLIEQVLAAHSQVKAAGELQQFRLAVRTLAGVNSPHVMSADVISATKDMDMAQLGKFYLDTSKSMTGGADYFIDKMPVNYMLAPLIAAALPQAKFIHLVRGAADSCVASYKHLFAEAYPHSYNQEEMARHHVRYRQLMEQWRSVMGDRLLDIHYEDAVTDLEPIARQMIDFVGIGWEDNCLDFHRQKTAVTTASAAQVREKIHNRSVGKWEKFSLNIQPMLKILSQAGYH